jgi:hypothetical protein
LSATEFDAFILPHLSMPKRGSRCKLGYHHLFNLIVWVLYTGMQRTLVWALEVFTGDEAALREHCEAIAREWQRQRTEAQQQDVA